MKLFVVYAPGDNPLGRADMAERMQFVPHGFNWMAFFLPLPWALYHRLWLVALAYGGLAIGLQALGVLSVVLSVILSTVFGLFFAFEANGLRRWTLEQGGWSEIASVAGESREQCEQRFFEAWLSDGAGAVAFRPASLSTPSKASGSAALSTIIRLFPSGPTVTSGERMS